MKNQEQYKKPEPRKAWKLLQLKWKFAIVAIYQPRVFLFGLCDCTWESDRSLVYIGHALLSVFLINQKREKAQKKQRKSRDVTAVWTAFQIALRDLLTGCVGFGHFCADFGCRGCGCGWARPLPEFCYATFCCRFLHFKQRCGAATWALKLRMLQTPLLQLINRSFA